MSARRIHYTAPPELSAMLVAHRAACSGDGRAELPTVLELPAEDTGLPVGHFTVNEDGSLTLRPEQ